MGSKGSKQKVRVAEYKMSLHLGFCYAVDSVLEIFVKEKSVWKGESSSNQTILLNDKNLFGGPKKEGGLFGLMDVMHGRSSQVLPSYFTSRLGKTPSTTPGFRDILSLLFYGNGDGFVWSHNYPYLHTVWARVKRTMNGGSQWYPEKAEIGNYVPYSEALEWQPETNGFGSSNIRDIVFAGEFFIAVGDDGKIQRSFDGVTWLPVTISVPSGNRFHAVDYYNGAAIVVGDSGLIYKSTDLGESWTPLTSGTVFAIYSIAAANGVWIAGIGGGTMLRSEDEGVTWTTLSTGAFAPGKQCDALAFGGGVWVAGWSPGVLARSLDNGLTWSAVTSPFNYYNDEILDIVFANGLFVASGGTNTLATSPDGLTWTLRSSGLTGTLDNTGLAYGNGLWIVANGTDMATSTDGITWTPWSGSSDNYPANGITYARNQFVAVGNGGSIARTVVTSTVEEYPDMNPAHIIRECLTNTEWGMSLPGASIDDAAFTIAADTLHAEGFGLSMMWSGQSDVETFVNEVLGHIDGVYGSDPATGKFYIKLIRGDYDVGTLPELTGDNCRITQFNRRAMGETTNEIVVTWTNPDNEEEQTVTVHDIANYAAQGVLISSSRNYYGIRNSPLAIRAAMRELGKASQPIATIEVQASRVAWNWKSGEVVKITYPQYGLVGLPCRITNINHGKPGEMGIKISLVEDVFAMPDDAYAVSDGSLWEPPPATVNNLTHTEAMTAPYSVVARNLGEADAAAVSYPDVFSMVLATGSGGAAEVYAPITDSVGGVSYSQLSTVPLSGRATLSVDLTKAVKSTGVAVTDLTGGVLPAAGVFAIIGATPNVGEITVIESGDAGSMVLRRGMLDTVAADWPSGTPIWFYDWNSDLSDGQTRLVGSSLTYRVAPEGTSGEGYLLAPVTFNSRPYRPYRPANVKINTALWPSVVMGDLTFNWSHRNRMVENSVPLLWDAASVTPEAGTTYNLKIYGDGDALLRTETGLTGTTYNLTTSDESTGDTLFPQVKLLLHMNDSGLSDVTGKTPIIRGGAARSSAQYKFDGYSMYLDGAGDGLSFATSPDWQFGSSNFCVEMQHHPLTVSGVALLIGVWRDSIRSWALYRANATLQLALSLDGSTQINAVITSNVLTVGAFHHIAFVRNGGTITLYVDEVSVGTYAIGGSSLYASSSNLNIGYLYEENYGPENAYIDEVRITRAARTVVAQAAAFPDYYTSPNINGNLRLTLEAVHDGYTSYQKFDHSFDRAGYGLQYGNYYGGI